MVFAQISKLKIMTFNVFLVTNLEDHTKKSNSKQLIDCVSIQQNIMTALIPERADKNVLSALSFTANFWGKTDADEDNLTIN